VGHQLNFYATPPDIAALGAAAARVEPMLAQHDRHRAPRRGCDHSTTTTVRIGS
jgi:hypothetical protein